MNVTLPDNKLDKKSKIVYAAIISICLVSIIVVVYMQFFEGNNIITVGGLKGKSEYDYETLKSNFDNLFDNSIQSYDEKYNANREDTSKAIVYTSYQNEQNKDGSYDLDVNIPYINIENTIIKKYNEEIKNLFEAKTEDILKTKNRNSIYNVEYNANIQDGILSVIIKANLKESSNPQRVIIKTYNFDIENGKEITISELLKMKNVEESYVQKKINEEIEMEHKKDEDLKSLGYNIFNRDLNDERYKLANITEFYYHDGSIYIIFAYGNDKHTSEVDVAVI